MEINHQNLQLFFATKANCVICNTAIINNIRSKITKDLQFRFERTPDINMLSRGIDIDIWCSCKKYSMVLNCKFNSNFELANIDIEKTYINFSHENMNYGITISHLNNNLEAVILDVLSKSRSKFSCSSKLLINENEPLNKEYIVQRIDKIKTLI